VRTRSTIGRGRISFWVGPLAAATVLASMLATTGCGLAGRPTTGGSQSSGGTSGGGSSPASNPSPSSVLTPSSMNVSFGNATVGTPTAQLVTLTDTGNANVTISGVSTTGPGFTASGGSGVTLTPNEAVTVSVNFSPTGPGGAQGNLFISSNASNSSMQIGLSGAGITNAVQQSVNLSWDPSTSTVIGYYVYRGTTTNNLLNLSASVDPVTSYTDSTVVSGETYLYAVTSVDSNYVESAQSTPISVTIPSQ
jgi:hypothetical protein